MSVYRKILGRMWYQTFQTFHNWMICCAPYAKSNASQIEFCLGLLNAIFEVADVDLSAGPYSYNRLENTYELCGDVEGRT